MKKLCLLLILCRAITVQAQGDLPSKFDLARPSSVFTASGNAAAFAKVADVPVSYYTGTPQISFPLFTIRSGSLQTGVSLGYSSSGLKVEEESSWVGLGWNLSIGGAIVRSAVGRPDESGSPAGYRNAAGLLNLPLYTDPNPSAWMNNLSDCRKKNLAEGVGYELTPDIFYLNFDGQNARMFFDRNGTALISPYKAWKVEGNTIVGFTITIENGTRYEFNTIESSSYDQSIAGQDGGSVFTCNSAWFLSRIISANMTDTIQFSYTPVSFLEEGKIPDQTRYELLPGEVMNPCYPARADFNKEVRSVNNQSVRSHILSAVTYRGGKLQVVVDGDRQDIGQGNKYKVRELVIYNQTGSNYTFLKKIQFNYDYFNTGIVTTNPLKNRLMLASFNEWGGSDSLKHTFEYYKPRSLPDKISKAQDHWGYYNGKPNTTLIPAYNNHQGFKFEGANREADENYAKIGLLQQITYPTGGTTTFEYEGHEYSSLNGQYVNEGGRLDSTLTDTTVTASTVRLTTENGEMTRTFFLRSVTPGAITQRVDISWFIRGKYFGDALAEVIIRNEAGNILFSSGNTNEQWRYYFLTLPVNQTYTITASRDKSTETAILHVNYPIWQKTVTRPTIYSKQSGGCRIKRIIQYDGMDHRNDIIKRFKYQLNDTVSSGIMLDEARYEDIEYTPYYCNPFEDTGMGIPFKGGDWAYFTRHAASMIALGRTQGSVIGYSKVTVLHGENGENGSEELYYSIKDFYDEGTNSYPFASKTSYDDLRGLLLQKKTFNQAGQLLTNTINQYNYNNQTGAPNFKWIYGVKYGQRRQDNLFGAGGCPVGAGWTYKGAMYKMIQFWPVMASRIDSIYDPNSGKVLVEKTTYTYDTGHLQVTREDKVNSDGATLSTTYTYPTNYPGIAVYDQMKSRYMLSPVIEKMYYRNNILYYREKNNYAQWGNIIAPASTEVAYNGQPVEIRGQYHKYDNAGNLLELSKTNDVREAYLWGYNNQYPVAKVTGSDYNTVIGKVNPQQLQTPSGEQPLRDELNKIRTGFSGNVPQATTYTYQPQVGITSETDPSGITTFYEFDGLGRLVLVRDKDRRVIKKFCYTYTGQRGECTDLYFNTIRSQSFTKNDCSAGQPSTVVYTVYAGKHSSAISQADADAKALNDITANGQAYANQQGVCTFLSAAQSVVYSKDCAVGGVGSYVTYNIPAGKYISVISQEDADVKAYNDIDDNAQIYANANGTCTFKNTVRSQAFTRNNCAAGGTPSSVTYTVPAGKHTSLISQADADAKALNDINANGQAYANTNATCTFYNTVRSQTFTRNNCATGGVPSNFTYIVPAARHSSLISQADADAKAQNDMNSNGQASANIDANATCTFSNTELRSDFRRAVCTDVGYVGGYITYIVPAAKYTSIIGQADADAKAQNDANLNGQNYANINGPCNCAAEGYKLINGNCEKGVRIDYQEPIGGGRCRNYYRYRFSDGSLSQTYNIAFDGC